MNIKIINPITLPHWNEKIHDIPGASIFHTSGWAKVLVDSYRYSPLYVSAFQDGQLTACLSMMEVNSFLTGKRGVCLPFTDKCPPIANQNRNFESLVEKAVTEARKRNWTYMEIRSGTPATSMDDSSETFTEHTLRLGEPSETLSRRFRSSTRRNIKKAQKLNVRIEFNSSLRSVRIFYQLNCITRKKHGLPCTKYC